HPRSHPERPTASPIRSDGAAVSIPSNIAERHSRRTLPAYLNHLSIALGSQSELETQVDLSTRLGLLNQQSSADILKIAGQVGRMLHSLIRALERKLP